MAHTKAPWTKHNGIVILDANDDAVCSKPPEDWAGAINWKDNAALIAAAPDLLKALEDLLTADKNGRFGYPHAIAAMDAARVAIAKAKGG